MYFNKLLKLVNKKKLMEGETCMICHFPVNNNDLKKITLRCKHTYHNSCLNINVKNISCPYCLQVTYSKKCSLCKKRVFNRKICEECTELNKNNKCMVKLKSGVRKGQTCNRINCKIHKIKKNICTVILKSGKRKGEVCSRENCKYHNKIKKNTKSTKSTKSNKNTKSIKSKIITI